MTEVLQSDTIQKVIFSAGSDSNGLRHQFNVTLNNVLDLQLLYTVHYGVNMPGLLKVLEEFMVRANFNDNDKERMIRAKQTGRKLVKPDDGRDRMGMWMERPLHPDLLDYAVADVELLIPMADVLLGLVRAGNPVRGLIEKGTPVRAVHDGRAITGTFRRDAYEPDLILVRYVKRCKRRHPDPSKRFEKRSVIVAVERALAFVVGAEPTPDTHSVV